MLAIPATWEAEAGELLDPGGKVAMSQDHAIVFPGLQSETLSK